MIMKSFSSYEQAKSEAIAYREGGKRHPGMKGVQYRVYCQYGEFQLWRGRSISDFPREIGYIFAAQI